MSSHPYREKEESVKSERESQRESTSLKSPLTGTMNLKRRRNQLMYVSKISHQKGQNF